VDARRDDPQGQGAAAAGISADASGADSLHLSSSRRGPASVARVDSPPRDGSRLRNDPAGGFEPAAARTESRAGSQSRPAPGACRRAAAAAACCSAERQACGPARSSFSAEESPG
jgi:hypothetical protein